MTIQLFWLIFSFFPFFESDQIYQSLEPPFRWQGSRVSSLTQIGKPWGNIAQSGINAQPQSNSDELEALSEQIRLNPNDAQAHQQRGTIYAASENYQKAIEDYSESLRLDPQNAQTYNYRGTAYYWLENYPRALEDFNQALQLNQEFTLAYYNRAYVRQKLGHKQEAIEDFQQGAALSLKQGDLETYEKALEIIRNLEKEENK